MPAIIYDFRTIGGTLRKQRIDDWWQPARPEPEPEPVKRMSNDALHDPFGWVFWPRATDVSELTAKSEAELRALMRADRLVQSKRHDEQVAVNLEAVGLGPVRPRPDPTPDKINEASKYATGC